MKANAKRYNVRVCEVEPPVGVWWSYNVSAKSHGQAVSKTLNHMGWGNCHVITTVKQSDRVYLGVR